MLGQRSHSAAQTPAQQSNDPSLDIIYVLFFKGFLSAAEVSAFSFVQQILSLCQTSCDRLLHLGHHY